MDGLSYPWCYLHRHPILVISTAFNYWQRKRGMKPDEWHPADYELMVKVAKKADNSRDDQEWMG